MDEDHQNEQENIPAIEQHRSIRSPECYMGRRSRNSPQIPRVYLFSCNGIGAWEEGIPCKLKKMTTSATCHQYGRQTARKFFTLGRVIVRFPNLPVLFTLWIRVGRPPRR